MSLQVSKVIAHVQAKPGGDQYPGHIIATTLALICGCAVLGMGLLRLGFLVEFIPAPAIAGFMTVSCACPLLSPPPSLRHRTDTRRFPAGLGHLYRCWSSGRSYGLQ